MYTPPDRNKPRVRQCVANIITHRDIKEFNKMFPEHNDITLKQFNNILTEFHLEFRKEIVNEWHGIKMPRKLGKVILASFKAKPKVTIDYGTSNKTGKLTFYNNIDTEGRMVKIFFLKDRGHLHNIKLWRFVPLRYFKQDVSKHFKENYEKYLLLENRQDIITLVAKKINT